MPPPERPFPVGRSPRPKQTPLLTPALCAALLWLTTTSTSASEAGATSWSLQAGDRVVLLGDTVIEREGERGVIETALVAAHPGADLTFRNLGWSGDTVWAESRGVFDAPSAGYARLLDLVGALRPTVVFVAYGRNESLAGAGGLEAFRVQLVRLCSDLRGPAGDGTTPAPRIVLVTPPPIESTPPLSAAAADARNRVLTDYATVIRSVATEQEAGLVDLFAATTSHLPAGARLTENGIHLTDAGYGAAAAVFAASCGKSLSGDHPGRTAAIRAAVNEKNRLFFHRWRPANETYLFLFRRHEQGNNAIEIPQFDALVDAAEAKVWEMARESP